MSRLGNVLIEVLGREPKDVSCQENSQSGCANSPPRSALAQQGALPPVPRLRRERHVAMASDQVGNGRGKLSVGFFQAVGSFIYDPVCNIESFYRAPVFKNPHDPAEILFGNEHCFFFSLFRCCFRSSGIK